MQFGEMQTQVAAFLQKETQDFVYGDVDLLAKAINRARKWAEKRRDFELARTQAQIANVDVNNGASLSGAVLVTGGTPVSVKTIESAFLRSTGGVDIPIGIQGRKSYVQRLRRMYKDQTLEEIEAGVAYRSFAEIAMSRIGNTVYVTPADTTTLGGSTFTLYMDIVQWMPDYSLYTDTDFFLTECESFILFRSIFELNFFLKDDQRVPISAELLRDEWNTVKEWDDRVAHANTDDTTLD